MLIYFFQIRNMPLQLFYFLAKMMTKSSPSGSLLRLSAFPGLSIISYAIHTHIFFQSMSRSLCDARATCTLIQYSYSHTITYVLHIYRNHQRTTMKNMSREWWWNLMQMCLCIIWLGKNWTYHFLEIRGLCLMKWPREMLQNLPYVWNTKT